MDRHQIRRIAVGACIVAIGIFLLISFLSYDSHDTSRGDHPQNPDARNLCGIVGAWCAFYLQLPFGYAVALAGAFVVIGYGVYVCLRGRPEDLWLKGLALVFFLPCAAIVVHLFLGGEVERGISAGGIVGCIFGGYAAERFGIGAHLLAGALAVISFLILTEMVPFRLVRLAVVAVAGTLRRRWRERLSREEAGKEARSVRRRIRPRREPAEGNSSGGDKGSVGEEPAPAKAKNKARDRGTKDEEKESRKDSREKPERRRAVTIAAAGSKTTMTDYKLPPFDLLDPVPEHLGRDDDEEFRQNAVILENTLQEFGIEAEVVHMDRGPVVTQYEIAIAPGIKITRIQSLADDIARSLKAAGVRVVAPIPGKDTIGIEVPNIHREMVCMRELIAAQVFHQQRHRMAVPLLLGKDVVGAPLLSDLAEMPHLLIAGATGAGKSVCINSLLTSMLMTQYPDNLKLILVDPVELAGYEGIPHLLSPVLDDMKRAAQVLEWACAQMDERYELFARVRVRNIASYNKLGGKGLRNRLQPEEDAELDDIPVRMPYVVLIIDEFSDMMMTSPKEVEHSIIRLAQKSRAVGIHIILATQRPSRDVITGLIKANLPCRLAFHASQKVDSRIILDRPGAEKLLGRGDMLFLPPGTSKLVRAQGTFAHDDEIKRVVEFIREQAKPQYHQELMQRRPAGDAAAAGGRDAVYEEAIRIVIETQRGSVSLLQRKLGIGYSRAARFVDRMAEDGIVGSHKGSQAREVLYKPGEWPGTGDAAMAEAGDFDDDEDDL